MPSHVLQSTARLVLACVNGTGEPGPPGAGPCVFFVAGPAAGINVAATIQVGGADCRSSRTSRTRMDLDRPIMNPMMNTLIVGRARTDHRHQAGDCESGKLSG